MDRHRDNEEDKNSRPGIPPPGKQLDQQQIPNAPPQPDDTRPPAQGRSSQWIPPTTGNPDLDPASLSQFQRVDLRQVDPLVPQGMLYDPRQMLENQRRARPDCGLPSGARFDPFGPPDPGQVGPGRGPLPTSQFGVPDPDHLPPPGIPQQGSKGLGGKSLKFPGPSNFPPPGGAGGGPFL